jgi:hypothetical protein
MVNDSFTSIATSLAGNIAGVGTGQNSLAAPQIANLLGFNIPGVPIISSRDLFLTQMESWFTSIPLTTQWIILINEYPKCVNTSILQSLERTDGSRKGFDIDSAGTILKSYPLQKITGCIFAQAVALPGEAFGTENINIDNSRGFNPVPISKDREPNNDLLIDFLETNTSFVDFVLRPWIIAGAHYGFVARDPNNPSESIKNVKTTITVLQYTRTYQGISMIPRKVWHYYNCAPTSIPNQQMGYDGEGFIAGRNFFQTKWTFSHYTVENNLYLPLPSIISRISSGQLPSILAPISKNLNPAAFF